MDFYLRDKTEFYVAIDNKGLWPNLNILPNGELGVLVYNHPSHGYGDGSGVELHVSADGGCSFQFRSLVSSLDNDDPNAIRMNQNFGITSGGKLISMVSGYQQGQKQPLLPLQQCVSEDNGHSWQHSTLDYDLVPYGSIIELPDKELVCCMYHRTADKKNFFCKLFSSFDSGASWHEKALISNGICETFLMYSSKGILYASGRTKLNNADTMDRVLPHGSGEKLFRSEDGGKTWSEGKLVSPQGQENAHLLELADGRLLYCFTSRIPGIFGVVYRISEDDGKTWSPHESLVTIGASDWTKTDAGYPSSVQLPDGTIVTAYYFGPKKAEYPGETTPWHQRYHMGIARWRV